MKGKKICPYCGSDDVVHMKRFIMRESKGFFPVCEEDEAVCLNSFYCNSCKKTFDENVCTIPIKKGKSESQVNVSPDLLKRFYISVSAQRRLTSLKKKSNESLKEKETELFPLQTGKHSFGDKKFPFCLWQGFSVTDENSYMAVVEFDGEKFIISDSPVEMTKKVNKDIGDEYILKWQIVEM